MAKDHGMHSVVVVNAPPSGKQHFFLDDMVLFVLGVNNNIGRLGDNYLIAQDSDAQW